MVSIEEHKEIEKWCKLLKLTNYTIGDDGVVAVDGNVDLSYSKFREMPIDFGRVTGWFDCSGNKIESLEGCPDYVAK